MPRASWPSPDEAFMRGGLNVLSEPACPDAWSEYRLDPSSDISSLRTPVAGLNRPRFRWSQPRASSAWVSSCTVTAPPARTPGPPGPALPRPPATRSPTAPRTSTTGPTLPQGPSRLSGSAGATPSPTPLQYQRDLGLPRGEPRYGTSECKTRSLLTVAAVRTRVSEDQQERQLQSSSASLKHRRLPPGQPCIC